MKELRILGVDLGNVIIDHFAFGTTRKFLISGDYCKIKPVENSIECIKDLARISFDKVIIIYNATDFAYSKIQNWLSHWDLTEDINNSSIQIVRSSLGRDKSFDCKRLNVTHFVDDRLEVILKLRNEVKNLYLFRPQDQEVMNNKTQEVFWEKANCWVDLKKMLQ